MPGDGAVMKTSANLPAAIVFSRAISALIGPASRYFSSLWHSGAFCCLLTCGKRCFSILGKLRELLELASAPALRHAAEAGHALRHVGLEADALLLSVIADIDAGSGLPVDDVADRFVQLSCHLGRHRPPRRPRDGRAGPIAFRSAAGCRHGWSGCGRGS